MQIAGPAATDSGMFGLWSPAAFGDVVDYDTWETALLENEDIARHIAAGVFVPINIGFDGAFQIAARVGSISAPAEFTDRERRYLFLSSDPYLFISTGAAVISGIEHVNGAADTGLQVPLPAGRWSVTIAVIAWDDEPGQKDEQGRPLPTALSDFTLLINPEQDPASPYRTKVATFDR